jgi:4-amino-4-deoxy-L-arabinose transferase-like glycosyltransferase
LRISALQTVVLTAVIFIGFMTLERDHTRVLKLQLITRRAIILGAAALLCALYLADLTGMGMVSKDEPRYADIGRTMAQSGDWITPRLWGRPWFEKPALLYWMTAAGFRLSLGPDLAPRLPVAILSLAFLAFFWARVRRLWDARVAAYSIAILSTSAGWLAFSHVAVTDLPLAVFFSAAVLLCLDTREGPARQRDVMLAAGALGCATLAKSLVPLVLFAPVVVLNYRKILNRRNGVALLVFAAITLPWHILCAVRNGSEFLRVLFVEQQFGRFFSPALQHVEPWWFYGPAALLLLFPWFPLLPLAARDLRDRRILILISVVVFGFVFFSASRNKLIGYLLPLLPAISLLLGIGLAGSPRPGRAVILPLALVGALPAAAGVLPGAIAGGLRSSPVSFPLLAIGVSSSALIGLALATVFRKATSGGDRVVFAASSLIAAAFLWFQIVIFPAIDATATARPMWLGTHPQCAPALKLGVLYSLNYYAGRDLPPCSVNNEKAVDLPAGRVVR